MRVNLLLNNPSDVRNGYLNIDVFASENDKARVKGEVFNLDALVDDGEAVEVVAHGLLDYATGETAGSILDNWVKKLSHGGQIVVSLVDLREVCRAFLAGTMSMDDVNTLLHGEQRESWQIKKCSFTLAKLVESLEAKGLKILSKRISNFRAVVTAERP